MSSALVRRDAFGQVKRSFCTATIESDRTWLLSNYPKIEASVRRVLVAAVQNLPPGQEDRRLALAAMYAPTDDDHGRVALDRFKAIKASEVQRAIAAKIARIAEG